MIEEELRWSSPVARFMCRSGTKACSREHMISVSVECQSGTFPLVRARLYLWVGSLARLML